MLQFLRDEIPRPSTGAPPLDPAGGLPSPRPPDLGPPFLNSEYATVHDTIPKMDNER